MLICFEGIDGSGKTTISSTVAARLRQLGCPVYHSRENERMASRIAKEMRNVTRNAENFALDPRAELMINLAREAELYAAVRGRLERGETVICDRFVYSHFVMARLRGLPIGLEDLVGLATGGREPDLVLFVDCDPDIGWLRKRARKIATYKIDEHGRKGAVFEDLGRKLRESYLSLAKARSWRILENSYVTASHSIGRAIEAISRGTDPAGAGPGDEALPPWKFEGDVENLPRSFFGWVGEIAGRVPDLAAMLVFRINSARAARIRGQLVSAAPSVVAAGLRGLGDPDSWRLRQELMDREPEYVARSLEGLESDLEAWEMRRRLAGLSPTGVLMSLNGLDGECADGMREHLWEAAPEAGLMSLQGLDGGRAWAWRYREFQRKPSGALALSLVGLDGEASWALREKLLEKYPYSVLSSVSKLPSDRAWRLRAEFGPVKAVMETITGLDTAEAWELRLRGAPALPETVAASLRGIATPESFRLRESLADAAPLGVVHSLKGLLDDVRAVEILRRIVTKHGGRLRVAHEAVRLLYRQLARAKG